MAEMLGNLAARRVLMMAELAKAGLKHPSQQLVKSMTYATTKQLVDPAKAAASDSRHRIMEKWVQAALNVALGLRLKPDGQWGGDTRAAIMRFQREEGLHAHGFLDDKTLQVLEERIGMRAPREGRLQGAPRLWQQDRAEQTRWQQRPGQPPDKPPVAAPAVPLAAQGSPELAHDPAQVRAAEVLAREAFGAAVQVAFAREWIGEHLEVLGQPDRETAAHAEMTAWVQQAEAAAEPPAWLVEVRSAAQARPAQAVAQLRQAWQLAHPEWK